MSTTEGGGNVVQDSLVYYLDASNPKSFTGGTYIKDLSRLQYSGGTLIGGASYSSSNQGCITFDGVDEYLTLDKNIALANNAISKYSFSVWISPTNLINSSNSNTYMIFEAQNTFGSPSNPADNYIQIVPSDGGRISFSTFNPSNSLLTTTNVWEANKWYNITCTYDIATFTKSIYVNGILENSSTAVSYFNTYHFFNLFVYSSPAKQWFFPGRLGNFMLYTKTLTATEVLQNYNAAKYKYI